MFGNILGKKNSVDTQDNKEEQDLINKISKMNLTDMRLYVNNKMINHEPSEDGIVEVMKRLTKINEETSKRYVEIDDMDAKIKKAFDLVVLLSNHRKMTVVAVELMQSFLNLYEDIILKYDTDNKQIYNKKLKDAINLAIGNINKMSNVQKELNVLGDD